MLYRTDDRGNEMRVLIGHDGSSYADDAIDDLRWAGLPAVVEALVVTVEEEPIVTPLAGYEALEKVFVGKKAYSIVEHANRQVADAFQEGTQDVLNAASRLRQLFPSWQLQTEVIAGRPATELIQRAKEWGADLIVVGSQGRTALGRLILGSVSMEVAAGAHCSVRIGRSSHEGTGLRVLVALDTSLEGQEALRLTLQRVWPVGTELRVVSVVDEDTPASSKFELLSNDEPKISAGVVKGRIEQVLMEEEHEWQADCIVIGLPSEEQVKELAANTKCSLEIIRLAVDGNKKG